ncbi:thioredoxin family protein [Lutibacter sp.]|uniref:TlpA family protein disulfide reductase n=1 Tax=Lutibacter sp. TaxID=1925666 RepID=UPI0025BC94F8|nr:thioredoxin family protein [Lutibacter sp.]MCF6168772.1 thioredoxin family protein [Lutibacter sp.]
MYIRLIYILMLLYSNMMYSQKNNCNITKGSKEIIKVNKEDVICLSRHTNKNGVLIYTFGIWCSPCVLHLPNALKLAQDYNLDLYVLLIDKEDDFKTINLTVNYLKKTREDINIAILKDESEKNRNRKYKRFLKKITPQQFENINGMSKYILINKKGDVIMVTNWKDNKKYDWRDDSFMLKEKIIPLLSPSNN